jgi:pilus assembly protein CpaB
MIRRSVSEGQPILPSDVVRPGDHGFLAAVPGPNMRAITVAVDAVSGTAGLIWPGDRIDLILTQMLDDPALAAGRRVAAETVLSDVRVIAVDQQIVQGQAPWPPPIAPQPWK